MSLLAGESSFLLSFVLQLSFFRHVKESWSSAHLSLRVVLVRFANVDRRYLLPAECQGTTYYRRFSKYGSTLK